MLSEQEALDRFKREMPFRNPQKIIVYRSLYLILAPQNDDDLEGSYDPYFSVDMNTGAIRDYSIYQDGNAREIDESFVKAPALK